MEIKQESSGPDSDIDIRFGKLLGCGFFGKVYKGTFKKLGDPFLRRYETECAIKTLTDLQSAEKEIGILMTLKHENIVGYLGWKRIDKYGMIPNVYMFMEYCNGGTLKDLLINKNRTDIEHLMWMLQRALGLEYLHSKTILHRDLKAENVLVNRGINGECLKVSDFGLSKKVPQPVLPEGQHQPFPLTPMGHVMTAAPEVISGNPAYDTKADVFSLGCIFYGMLEHCFKVVDGCHHFSAFVYFPEQGDHIPLGTVLFINSN